jgi:hypothetical protein
MAPTITLSSSDDAALWQAARATLTAEQRDRLEALHDQKREDGLDVDEAAEEEALLALYRATVLLRAQAAVLLKHRGHDVSDPTQFEPLT